MKSSEIWASVAVIVTGIALFFLRMHAGNWDIVRWVVAFTLVLFGVRHLWMHRKSINPENSN